jgi:hypothetical protein
MDSVNGFGSYKTAGEQVIETLVVPLCKILTACLVLAKSESYIHIHIKARA